MERWFRTSFVKGVLDNPVYCGKLAFGRRKKEKILGTRNEYHIGKQDKYMLNDGIHEAIVSDKHYDKKYEDMQADGRILHSLKFRFPVFFNGKEIYELD